MSVYDLTRGRCEEHVNIRGEAFRCSLAVDHIGYAHSSHEAVTGTWLPDRHGDTYTPSPAAQVIAAAVRLRDLERRGQFQTDEWWAASYRLRDATDRLEVGFNDEEKAS